MRRVAVGLAACLVFVAMPRAHAATPVKVLDDPKVNEISVAASVDYFAWSANSEAKPDHFNAFVMPSGGGTPTRVNPTGTRSYSVGIDGSLLVYQESTQGQNDLSLYDAATQTRPALPAGVNTKSSEYRPSLSGDWLLFTRTDSAGSTKVILFNVTTDEKRVLRKADAHYYLVSDQVNGDWATFEDCRLRNGQYKDCNIFRYQISTLALEEIPNPGKQQYAGGVSQDGTVYITRTGDSDKWICGDHARILRYPVGGPGVVIVRFQQGTDTLATFATDETDGSTTVYIEQLKCDKEALGFYSIANADTTT